MTWFNNMKMVFKILSLVCIMLALISYVGYTGYKGADNINNYSDEQHAATVAINRGHLLLETALKLNTSMDELGANPSRENADKIKAADAALEKQVDETFTSLDKDASETQKDLLKKAESAYAAYQPALGRVIDAAEKADPANPEAAKAGIRDAAKGIEEPVAALESALNDFVKDAADHELSIDNAATDEYNKASKTLMVTIGIAVVLGLLLGSLLALKGVANPLKSVVGVLQKLTNNDLSVAVTGTERKDEVGDVCRAAQAFKDVLVRNHQLAEQEKLEQKRKEERQRKVDELIKTFDGTATQTVAAVSSASTQLSQTAEHMTKIATDTNHQSTNVAAASQEASTNVQTVASAAEEMSSTVQEISRQVSRSIGLAQEAMSKSETADKSSRELIEISNSVGSIAEMIEDIASQINLLSLNATIESARSGEAGKGFAVVANEVKVLAGQTSKATEEIRQKLEGVQKTAVAVADIIAAVRDSIKQVNEAATAIAAAVEEQSAATNEIVNNMSTASKGVEQINTGIFSIKGGTDSTTAATAQVRDAASMLSRQAERMDVEVKQFLQNIKAA